MIQDDQKRWDICTDTGLLELHADAGVGWVVFWHCVEAEQECVVFIKIIWEKRKDSEEGN